jgi:hypothetical protein
LLFLFIGGGSFLLISKPWDKKTNTSQLVQDSKNQIQPNKEATGSNDQKLDQQKTVDAIKETGNGKTSSINQDQEITAAGKGNKKELISDRKNKTFGRFQLETKTPINNSNTAIIDDQKSTNTPADTKIDRDITKHDKQKSNQKNSETVNPDLKVQPDNTDVEKINNESITKEEDKNKVIENTDQGVKTETRKSPKNKLGTKGRNGFSFSVSAGPDVSKAPSSEVGKVTLSYGAGIGYTKNRVTLRTGLYASRKVYYAEAKSYKLGYTPPPSYTFEGANANCYVLEIPVKLSYSFGIKDNRNWFAGAGLSSYLMKSEKYDYIYKAAWGPDPTYHHEIKNKNKHYFSILNVSGGYTRQLNKSLSLSVEPYIEVPMSGIGLGEVHLNSGGVLFTLGVKPFKK